MGREIEDLMAIGGQMGADWLDRREQRKYNEQRRIAYFQALKVSQETAQKFPDHFQQTYPTDYYGEQRIIKTVLLRELAKLNPNHPMLGNECRSMVSQVGLALYNRANRPADGDYADYAPDDETAQRIFAAYPLKK